MRPARFSGAWLARRLPGHGRGLLLVLLALLAHALLPLGAVLPMGEGSPDSDICVSAPRARPSPAEPATRHDSPCCALHCLSCSGAGGLPATPPDLALNAEFRHAVAVLPGSAVVSEPSFSLFSARAPPQPV